MIKNQDDAKYWLTRILRRLMELGATRKYIVEWVFETQGLPADINECWIEAAIQFTTGATPQDAAHKQSIEEEVDKILLSNRRKELLKRAEENRKQLAAVEGRNEAAEPGGRLWDWDNWELA